MDLTEDLRRTQQAVINSAQAERAEIEVGSGGMSCLIGYPGPNPLVALLQEAGEPMTDHAGSSVDSPKSTENVDVAT